jgi:hypothetical protein
MEALDFGHQTIYGEQMYIFSTALHKKSVGEVSDPEATLANHNGLWL